MRTTVVIAGRINQFRNLIEDMIYFYFNCDETVINTGTRYTIDDKYQYIYITDELQLRGLRFDDIIFVGDYYRRDNLDKIREVARINFISQGKEVPESLK